MSGRRSASVPGIVATVVVCGLLTAMGVALRSSQRAGGHLLEARFDARAVQAARFVQTYTDDLLDREARVASRHLGAGDGGHDQFAYIVEAFDFPAAVLLDSGGHVVDVSPARADLVGRDMTVEYPHLRAAVAGHRAVSAVVPSAVERIPVVAFATPFQTAAGPMVFSGAYAVADTPIAAFLRGMSSVKGYRVFLIDSVGAVAASNVAPQGTVHMLRDRDAALATAVKGEARHGSYRDSGNVSRYFVTGSVPGTPWTIVATAPKSSLYAAVRGPAQWVPWLVLGVLALLAGVALVVSLRYVAGRRSLAVLSDTDPLTRIANRRSMERHLEAFSARGRRDGRPWSMLLVDLDLFKRVNDTFGHQAGDRVLEVTAERMRGALRLGDEIGRWGGEEFLVLLADTAAPAAAAVAERLRTLCSAPIQLEDGGILRVTISVGCAETTTADPERTLAAADRALYAAKANGRDSVVVAPAQMVETVP